MRRAALAAACLALAGCSSGGEETAPATTEVRTVTVSKTERPETPPAPDRAGSLAAAIHRVLPAELARSSELRLGDAVIALGFPLGLGGPSVTSPASSPRGSPATRSTSS